MLIRIANFTGQFPRINETRLKDSAAALAQNVNFNAGTLKPLFKLSSVRDVDIDTQQVYLLRVDNAEYWFQFKSFVNLILGPIKDDSYHRVYWTGDIRENGIPLYGTFPEMVDSGEPYPNTHRKLGLPAPSGIPTIQSVSPELEEDENNEVRFYVYTYINSIGEESAPSNPSQQVETRFSSTVIIGNLQVQADAVDRDIVGFRIYRTLSGSGNNADFRYVGQASIDQVTFTDNLLSEELGEVLPTTTWDMPRQDMLGMGLTAYGVAYGFSGKIVCLSEPFYIYAFPRDYELTTQYDIVAMGHYDNIIVVATKGNPVMITGIDPASGMTMTELPVNESCVAKRSLVSLAYGVIYASPNGLVLANASGAVLVSENYFDRDQWNALNPPSIHAVEYRGKYLFFYHVNESECGAYIFDPRNLDAGIVHIDEWCISTFRDMQEDKIYLLKDDGHLILFDLNHKNGRKSFKWRSKKFRTDNVGTRFLAMRVVAESYNMVRVRIYADDKMLYEKVAVNDRPFRLPNHSRKMYWQIEVIAVDEVLEISLGETMQEVIGQ